MTPTKRQLDAMKLLGISLEEWHFTCGRYLEARDELGKLRMGVARIAQHLWLDKEIPGHDTSADLFRNVQEVERGWNRLCAMIINRIEEVASTVCEGCGRNIADPPSKLCPGCEAYREHQA